MIPITAHAIHRAIQRIPGLRSEIEAMNLLSCRAVERAAEFAPVGSIWVKLSTGQHIALQDGKVVTVLSADLDMRKMSAAAQDYRMRCRAHALANWKPGDRDPAQFEQQGVH